MSEDFSLAEKDEKKTEAKKKNAELFYAFSIDEKKNRGKGEKELNFAQINKGFYDELISYDDNIRKSRDELKKQKSNGIKESVYSNKQIPDTWRNKITYYQDLFSTMSRDKKFVSYLGRGNNYLKNEENKQRKTNAFPKKSLKINTEYDPLSIAEKGTESKNTQNNSPHRKTYNKNVFSTISNYISDTKEITNILEEYKASYPIKLPHEIKTTSNTNVPKIDFPIIKPNNLNQTCKTVPLSINPNQTQSNVTNSKNNTTTAKKGIFTIAAGMNKSQVFKTTIYSNLIPATGARNLITEGNKVTKSTTIYSSPYLNANEEFFRKVDVLNPKIDKKLKDIQYYGPYYSHCPPCRNKNINFYNTMETNQCMELLNYLRGIRKKHKLPLKSE